MKLKGSMIYERHRKNKECNKLHQREQAELYWRADHKGLLRDKGLADNRPEQSWGSRGLCVSVWTFKSDKGMAGFFLDTLSAVGSQVHLFRNGHKRVWQLEE